MRSPGVTAAIEEHAADIARLRVTVHTLPIDALPAGWWGAYDAEEHAIYLAESLAPLQARSTLAHELAHAEHRHHGSTDEQEQEARHAAAQKLIGDPSNLAAAVAGLNLAGALAIGLGVLPRDIRAFIEANPDAAAQAIMGTLVTHAGSLTIPRPTEYAAQTRKARQ